jgi:hypothetical protein
LKLAWKSIHQGVLATAALMAENPDEDEGAVVELLMV